MNLLDVAVKAVTEHGAIQKPAELAGLLAVAAASKPKVVFEIGTARGGTLWALAQVVAAKFVSIDLPGAMFGGPSLDPLLLEEIPGLVVVNGDSLKVPLPSYKPDLLFIDGDHTEAGVRGDYGRYAPLVTPGGVVAFHDILPHPVHTEVQVDRLWAEIVTGEPRRTIEIVDRTEPHWGGIGVVFTDGS